MEKKTIIVILVIVGLIAAYFLFFRRLEMFGGSRKAIMEPNPEMVRLPRPQWANAECLRDDVPFVYRLHSFLTPSECKHLIDQAGPGFNRSKVVDHDNGGKDKLDTVRTSSSSYLQRGHTAIIKAIEERAAGVFGVPVTNIEPLQVVRYHPGEKYDSHHDFFHHVSGPKGQRYGTILVYLNDEFEGGTTSFPKCGLEVKPITGDGIFWYDSWLRDGKCYCFEDSLHRGNPPKTGVKYALNVWIRFDPFL
jgi:prolyl 4-hydroxylase